MKGSDSWQNALKFIEGKGKYGSFRLRMNVDSGPPFRRSARVNPNPNPDPRNGGPRNGGPVPWTCGCAGKTVKTLENTCHTWALLQWWFTTKRRYIKCMHLYLLPLTKVGEIHLVCAEWQRRREYVANNN